MADEASEPKKKQAQRHRTDEEDEAMQKKAFDLRLHGMTHAQLGVALGVPEPTARAILKRAQLAHVREIEADGWKSTASAVARKYSRAAEVAWVQMRQLDGIKSPLPKAIWMQTYLKCVQAEEKILIDTGLIPKVKDRLEITFQDARSMSIEELQMECSQLEAKLAGARIIPDSMARINIQKGPVTRASGQANIKKALEAEVDKTIDVIARVIEKDERLQRTQEAEDRGQPKKLW